MTSILESNASIVTISHPMPQTCNVRKHKIQQGKMAGRQYIFYSPSFKAIITECPQLGYCFGLINTKITESLFVTKHSVPITVI